MSEKVWFIFNSTLISPTALYRTLNVHTFVHYHTMHHFLYIFQQKFFIVDITSVTLTVPLACQNSVTLSLFPLFGLLLQPHLLQPSWHPAKNVRSMYSVTRMSFSFESWWPIGAGVRQLYVAKIKFRWPKLENKINKWHYRVNLLAYFSSLLNGSLNWSGQSGPVKYNTRWPGA